MAFDEKYFLERFSSVDTEELLQRLLLRDITDEARAAIIEILTSRGVVGHAFELHAQDAVKAVFRRSGVTNQCDFCGKNVLSAIADGGQKFCSRKCLEEARLAEASIGLAPDLVLEHARSIRLQPCPVCSRHGPVVEMRKALYVSSLIWFFHTDSGYVLSCRKCGRARNLRAAAICALTGWWSIPGLFATPVFIYQNVWLALKGEEGQEPSLQLVRHAQRDLAASLRTAGVLA